MQRWPLASHWARKPYNGHSATFLRGLWLEVETSAMRRSPWPSRPAFNPAHTTLFGALPARHLLGLIGARLRFGKRTLWLKPRAVWCWRLARDRSRPSRKRGGQWFLFAHRSISLGARKTLKRVTARFEWKFATPGPTGVYFERPVETVPCQLFTQSPRCQASFAIVQVADRPRLSVKLPRQHNGFFRLWRNDRCRLRYARCAGDYHRARA